MLRTLMLGALALVGVHCPLIAANPIRGKYVEARTCQVYTGPCFANGEVGSVGKDAVMTWMIERGSFAGIDLSGHSAAVIVKASHTLGFNGFRDAESIKAIVIVDSSADAQEQAGVEKFCACPDRHQRRRRRRPTTG